MVVDTSGWSGEGAFTQALIDELQRMPAIAFLHVEDAPATRSEADYNFISNEIYVRFTTTTRVERGTRFGVLPRSTRVEEKTLTIGGLSAALAANPEFGAPDYEDEAMLQ